MPSKGDWLVDELERRGVTRREFAAFCSTVAGILMLPRSAGAELAQAMATGQKPTLVWLEFQDCAGNTESFLRAARPSAADILLDTLSVDYHETIMAAAGHQSEAVLQDTVASRPGEYLVVVEGSIPTGANGAYCTIGGRSALDIVREVCGSAQATIAVGTCAAFGGIPAAAPNPTGALSVADAVPGIRNLINLPACPANAANLAALVVYFVTYGRWPPLDQLRRPLFAYGKTIHDNCERRAHYDAGQYVELWGDPGHRKGYCLYKVGCKGPVCFQNCPEVGWNEGTNWPVGCGHPCLGCAEPDFWDKMTPFYAHLDGFPGFSAQTPIDRVGAWGTLGVAAAFGAHALIQLTRRRATEQPSEGDAADGDGP
jgi:hydrogenase small subunit